MGYKNLKFKKWVFLVIFLVPLFIILYNYRGINKQTDKNSIPIAMAMDENYVFPTIVAITSVLESRNQNSYYSFYVMHPDSLSEESKDKLLSLHKKYNKCQINLIEMKDQYNDAYVDSRIPKSAYYRLSLPELLTDIKKVIWIDGDTLTFHDLNDLLNIDMDEYYFKGFLDDAVSIMDEPFGIYNDHYICSGVMLINLEKLRNDNINEKFISFIRENNDKLKQHDQTVINVVCYKNIGILPAKYGIFNYITEDRAQAYVNSLRTPQKYTIDEVIDAIKDPWILHCPAKPWVANASAHTRNLWLQFAQKTDFFEEIKAKYSL